MFSILMWRKQLTGRAFFINRTTPARSQASSAQAINCVYQSPNACITARRSKMNSIHLSCIYSRLHDMSAVLTYDQPLRTRATELHGYKPAESWINSAFLFLPGSGLCESWIVSIYQPIPIICSNGRWFYTPVIACVQSQLWQ